MRGSITRRSAGSWTLVFDLGYVTDPKTGGRRRRQKRVTVRGTKQDAQAKLTELLGTIHRREFVEASKLTVGEWLREWLEKAIKPPARRANTYAVYRQVIEQKLVTAIGGIRLQELKASDVKRYYTDQAALSPSTLAQHHAILHSALKAAVLEGLVARNVASLVIGKPQPARNHEAVARNCWEAEEARAFLKAAKETGPQEGAFAALALDSGARKGELCGLRWSDLDLDGGAVTFMQQLTKAGRHPTFGPLKNGTPRTVDLSPETISLLRDHKRAQAEIKMANRTVYRDLGLVFAKEWRHLYGNADWLGLPLQANNIGEHWIAHIIEAAKVRRITIHGLRHTSATLLLKAGVSPHVVQRRLGHASVTMTLEIYAHVLPSMQQDAARRLGALLYGSGS